MEPVYSTKTELIMPQLHRGFLANVLLSYSVLVLWQSVGIFSTGMSLAQDGAAPNAVSISISSGGVRRYERGKWSVLRVNASNNGSEEREAALSLFLEKDSRTQFTRKFWIPAHSSRQFWLPILPPDDIPVEQNALHASVIRTVETEEGLVLDRSRGEQFISETLLSLDPLETHTATIFGKPAPGHQYLNSKLDDEAYETVVALRMLHSGDRKTTTFEDMFLPAYPESYDALDQLVIASDRFVADSGGLAALRSWIARGGHAWIMLDLVGMDAVHSLLGNATPCEIIDRVEFTEFTIETPNAVSVGADPTEVWSAEEPVEFVRVLTDSAAVYSSIDGWPAAFSIPFGNGSVLITTLAARGWRYQHDEFAEPVDPKRPTSGPTYALRYLASEFSQLSNDLSPLGDELKPILSEQLGYRVPSRKVAAFILGLNCTIILAAGVWFARREHLERMAWVVPVATGFSAILLVAIGSANTSSIPATSSILRLANVSSETNEIHSDALAAFYSPDTTELQLRADLSSVVLPELQDLTGSVKRATWDDDGDGGWQHVDVASGSVRFAEGRENQPLEYPLRARASFGPTGLEGRIVGVGQIGKPVDAIAAAPPAPHSEVVIEKSGGFHIGADKILSEGEFLSGTMLSDEQQRRQSIYRHILAPRQGSRYPQRPTLFVWGDTGSFGVTTPELFHEYGATLFAIPLDIGRTAQKQKFLVPSTFIQISNPVSRHGASAFYNPRTGEWMKDATNSTNSFFRFTLPRGVTPCKVTGAEITLRIHAPSRTVEITGLRDDQVVALETLESPTGALVFKIDDPQVLTVDGDGAMHFGVTVSMTETQAKAAAEAAAPQPSRQDSDSDDDDRPAFDNSTWHIDYLRLQVTGETL